MADDFLEIYRTLSRGLHAKAEEAGIFKHRSAKGDGRENVFTDFLRQRIGSAFDVAKAEVVDANGESSDELDAAVPRDKSANGLPKVTYSNALPVNECHRRAPLSREAEERDTSLELERKTTRKHRELQSILHISRIHNRPRSRPLATVLRFSRQRQKRNGVTRTTSEPSWPRCSKDAARLRTY
jgi:hypothetical protein